MTETFTPAHTLSKFDQGDNPGAVKLNANWTKIDLELFKKATSFPATHPIGGVVLRTDEKKAYQNTGTVEAPVWTLVLDGTVSIDVPAITFWLEGTLYLERNATIMPWTALVARSYNRARVRINELPVGSSVTLDVIKNGDTIVEQLEIEPGDDNSQLIELTGFSLVPTDELIVELTGLGILTPGASLKIDFYYEDEE